MRLFWLNDVTAALEQLKEVEQDAKDALPHFPPLSGNLPSRRLCQATIARCRAIALQYKQHVAAGRASAKFYPGQLIKISVANTEVDAVYVSFENFTKPIYLTILPEKGECWTTVLVIYVLHFYSSWAETCHL